MRTLLVSHVPVRLLCGLVLLVPPALRTAAAQDAGGTLNVQARLVVVPVTVRDNKEHLIRSLSKDDFKLQVDGKPQAIRYFDKDDDLPLTVGLLVDVSGSQRTVLDEERTASEAFLDNLLQAGRDRAFAVQFGRSADLLADTTGSLPKLQAALNKIDGDTDRGGPSNSGSNGGGQNNGGYGGGQDNGGYGGQRRGRQGGGGNRGPGGNNGAAGTVLYDAVYLASTEVFHPSAGSGTGNALAAGNGANSAEAGKPTRRAMIVLTDGDDRGSKESLAAAIEAAQRADATLYAIYYKGEESRGPGGFPMRLPGGRGGFPGGGGRMGDQRGERNDGKKILERMAGETGGRVYEVSKKMPLSQIYREIGEELRSEYRLGFSPVNNEDGYHRIAVDTPAQKKVILQFRDGYYTGAQK